MSDGSWELQQAIATALASQPVPFFSFPAPANTPIPYIEIGETDALDDVQRRAGLEEDGHHPRNLDEVRKPAAGPRRSSPTSATGCTRRNLEVSTADPTPRDRHRDAPLPYAETTPCGVPPW